MAFQQRAARMAPTTGPTTIIQKSGHAAGLQRAGPKLRAGIDRAVVDGNAYGVYKAECQTDGETGEFAETFMLVGGTEHHKHEEEGEEALDHKCHPGVGSGLDYVGSELRIAGDSAEFISGSHIYKPIEKAGAYCSSD